MMNTYSSKREHDRYRKDEPTNQIEDGQWKIKNGSLDIVLVWEKSKSTIFFLTKFKISTVRRKLDPKQ